MRTRTWTPFRVEHHVHFAFYQVLFEETLSNHADLAAGAGESKGIGVSFEQSMHQQLLASRRNRGLGQSETLQDCP